MSEKPPEDRVALVFDLENRLAKPVNNRPISPNWRYYFNCHLAVVFAFAILCVPAARQEFREVIPEFSGSAFLRNFPEVLAAATLVLVTVLIVSPLVALWLFTLACQRPREFGCLFLADLALTVFNYWALLPAVQ